MASSGEHWHSVLQELGPGWKKDDVESWLFHGTDAIEDVLRQGFKTSAVSLKRNKYGVGVYFAPDPRLAAGQYRDVRNLL